MTKTNNSDYRTFFISWSGAQSQELAYAIRDLLCSVFRIDVKDFFISDSDLAGDKPWIEMIRKIASNAKVQIICMTQENFMRPWIHYELGICSCLGHETPKTIIPVYFNISSKDVPSHLYMITQNQGACIDCESDDDEALEGYYRDLCKRIIYQIDYFASGANNNSDIHMDCYNFDNNNDDRILGFFSKQINKTVENLMKIFKKYNEHDVFISRPILGVPQNLASQIEAILKEIKDRCSSTKIYFSENKQEQVSIPLSRIDIIKNCRSFIMIYPKIQADNGKLSPSSCFIELGAAMALNKEIRIYAEEGAVLPAFMDEKYKLFRISHFSDYEKLRDEIIDLINKIKHGSDEQ